MNRKGFTLVELIVVIAIIAILAAVVAPTAMRAVDRARVSSTIEDYQAVKSACFSYNADTGVWPRNNNLGDLMDNTAAAAPNYDGPYIERLPISRWGGQFGTTLTYTNTVAGGTVCGAAGAAAPERFLTYTNVPTGAIGTAGTVRNRLDAALDNGDGATGGVVRENAGNIVLCISRN